MKNSLTTIIIIITALTFYSCSDEDDIKTEPEKSIEDCLEFIREVEKEYIAPGGSFGTSSRIDSIMLDTCSFRFDEHGYITLESLELYIDRGSFSISLQDSYPFFNNNDEIHYSEDISENYNSIKMILTEYENLLDFKFHFKPYKGQKSAYYFGINKFINDNEIKAIDIKIEELGGHFITVTGDLFKVNTKMNTELEKIK